ncbi:LamG domain-containing protein [Streptomyces griseoincarnatus]
MTLPAELDLASVARGAAGRMSRRLTAPFAAGGDVLHLALTPAAGVPDSADVGRYDFTDHVARFGALPTPSYVVRTLRDLDRDTRVTAGVSDPALTGGAGSAEVVLPAGALAGESVPLLLPAGATGAARLTRLTVARRAGPGFASAPGAVADEWAVTALLGHTARLLWVLGAERDVLRRQIARTAAQRQLGDEQTLPHPQNAGTAPGPQLPTAFGVSLDLLGADLAVPRFPPLAYSVDDDTVALYHLDDAPGSAVEDFTGRFPGRTAHNGTVSGSVTLGVLGRYGTAAAFTGSGAVTVASATAFDVPADAGLTVECFVKPDADGPDARLLARRAATGAGWSVELGAFGRGLPRTVRATVSDGTHELVLYGGRQLGTERFTHVALVLDRAEGSVALLLDGARADVQPASGLGALTAAQPVVIGPGAGTPLHATVDEVRISQVARRSFAPVLGEDDDHYRRRLGIFRRWTLPTPAALTAVLNDVVGTIGGVADPLVVDDTDSPADRGHLVVRVVPAALPPGESMDAAGRRGVASEDELYGDADDLAIDPVLLLKHDAADVDYGPVTSGDAHLMQPPLARMLDRLRTLAGAAGRLRVVAAWTPDAADARAAGRAVVLRHSTIAVPELAALAHRAGFLLVRTLPDATGVYASCAPGTPVVLGLPGAAAGQDITVEAGSTVTLAASPVPPAAADVRWSVAAGAVRVAPAAAGQATVTAVTPGPAVITLDVVYGGFAATASAAVRVLPATLATGASIAADGTLGAGPDAAGAPAERFDPAFLVKFTDPAVILATQDAGRMQPGTAGRLRALLSGLTGTLTLSSGFVPVPAGGAPTLASQGRALTMRHSALAAGRLAALAHAAGFSWVKVDGSDVKVLHRAEDLVVVSGPAEVEEGADITLQVAPDPSAVSAATRLLWSTGPLDPTEGRADVASTALPTLRLTGRQAGRVWVQAALREAGANGPYALRVRLAGTVPAGTKITRDKYDLIMNVVHALHPLGVEVLTRDIRPAVVELAGLPSLDPVYTYPKFRLHRSTARLDPEQLRKGLDK